MGVSIFNYGETISRSSVNSRIDQMLASFGVPISKGGTGGASLEYARDRLGCYTRQVMYSNSSGSTGPTITLNYNPAMSNLYKMGIYYGFGSIVRYIEPPVYGISSAEQCNATLHYVTGGGNLVMRTVTIECQPTKLRLWGNRSDFFSTDGTHVSTEDDELLAVYRVVGFYMGSDYN